ncbi:uncharacterized protein SPAPADRAFT_58774 [Spathaspora passalidarum NRRL Y-27907]|uniref:DASH complex subunit SPC34 n=1 Tax=Spathaspora passalidarum (strain NRRL Y-27907 / 11-Y1) TaxID=619300 RepID=G3AE08_SPAPN|nr:uncharacterized protein SPAPADRAFT_58774 [Spathaspora passalidarum NRRL Y-27907]EGW35543.1 hypothetical protein SPAPADRAFT_58774 [Spathaspora passalidarum NRRL Y-27907]
MSLNRFLDRIDESSIGIQECKFPENGMFTNAMINSPGIITLLKDTYQDEGLLYATRNPEIQPQTDLSSGIKKLQRRDSRKLFEEQDYLDFEDVEELDRPFVRLPELANQDLPDVSFVPFDADSNDLGYLIQWNKEVLLKYPLILEADQHIQELVNCENEYIQTTHDIKALEEEVNRNKELINLRDGSGRIPVDRAEEDRAIDACTQKQEEEIRELEAQLMEIQNRQ